MKKDDFEYIMEMNDDEKCLIANALIELNKKYPAKIVLQLGMASLCSHAIGEKIPREEWAKDFVNIISSVSYMLAQNSTDNLMPQNEAISKWFKKTGGK